MGIRHGLLLHGPVSVVAGQAAPPFCGCTVIARVRDWVPPLQVILQLPHPLHMSTTQLTAAVNRHAYNIHPWVLAIGNLIAGVCQCE